MKILTLSYENIDVPDLDMNILCPAGHHHGEHVHVESIEKSHLPHSPYLLMSPIYPKKIHCSMRQVEKFPFFLKCFCLKNREHTVIRCKKQA